MVFTGAEVKVEVFFHVDRTVITKHLKNIYAKQELDKISTSAKIAQVQITRVLFTGAGKNLIKSRIRTLYTFVLTLSVFFLQGNTYRTDIYISIVTNMENIQLFQGKKIRRVWDETKEIRYFSIIDIVAILTEQNEYQKARKYRNKLIERLRSE